MKTKNQTTMGKTKNNGVKMDPEKVTELFKKLMDGARKGLDEFTAVAQETTFEVRIISDENGIGFEADLNIVPDYERDDVYEEENALAEEVPAGTDMNEFFKEKIKIALDKANGNINKAAEMLGLSTRNLKRKLALYNL